VSKGAPLVEAEQVKVWFPVKAGIFRKTVAHVKAVNGISFKLARGNCLGVVGESGSGKTSLGLAILKLIDVKGKIVFLGKTLTAMDAKAIRALRPAMQMVFQDPFGSLSPRMTIGDIITEGVRVHQKGTQDYRALARTALEEVGLEGAMQDRYPHEFSGGQRQRIAIARALALRPSLIVLDEPTSGLDRAIQSKIIDLLKELQANHDLAYIFISHDLKVVKMLAQDIIVMKAGQVVEQGRAKEIFDAPGEIYTQQLMKAAFEKII
jgi:microcin C transport system ATP-binding protein